MKNHGLLKLLGFALSLSTLHAEQVVCKPTADTWVNIAEFGQFQSAAAKKPGHGDDTRLIISGRDSLALLAFDLSPVKGMTVSRATLRVYREPDPVPLTEVGLSTVSGAQPWTESGAGFVYSDANSHYWSYHASDITDVTFGAGGSLYTYVRARDAGEGWYEIDVAPALVHALLSGDQYGLMFDDEKGQTHTRHTFSSREGAHPPILIVEGTREDHAAPGPARALRAGSGTVETTPRDAIAAGLTGPRPGMAIVRFGRAGDDAGTGIASHYELRWSTAPIDASNFNTATLVPRWEENPLVPKPSPLITSNSLHDEVTAVVEGLEPGHVYHFAARALDEAGNAGPVSSIGSYRAYGRQFPALPEVPEPKTGKSAGAKPAVWAMPELWKVDPRTGGVLEAAPETEHRLSNPVWNAGKSTVSLEGSRNEFVGFQVVVEGAGHSGVNVKVTKPLFPEATLPSIFRATGAVQLYREWFVPDDRKRTEPRGWYPDPLIPLTAAFDVPAKDNGVPGQTAQPVFADVYIPKDARPGPHKGELVVTSADGLKQVIHLEVNVLPLVLPDQLDFLVDLNCYGGVDSGWNIKRGTPEYRQLEIAYHRMAHLNRANLDVLGYNHDGRVDPDHVPLLSGTGGQSRVSDWSGYDSLFGPLLDGSAFEDLPRAGVPVPVVYLPFFEGWPGDYRRGYKWDDPTIPQTEAQYQQLITKHALTAGPIENGFTREYKDRAVTVAEQFARHIIEKNWLKTRFMVFFNDKYYFKRPAQGGQGISWWLMDEPNHRDDSRAMSYLSSLFLSGTSKYPVAPIVYRIDLSRVEWARDLLTDQIDIDCTSQHLFSHPRHMLDNRPRFGKEFWHYSSTNHPRTSNVSMRAWAWKAWLGGADGIVPWLTVHGYGAWDRADPLTVFYVGTKFGSKEPFGSLRLKAFRRGQQDVEYLVMLAHREGWGRDGVTHAVAGALDFSGQFKQSYAEDAGTMDYRHIKDATLEDLRRRVARALLLHRAL